MSASNNDPLHFFRRFRLSAICAYTSPKIPFTEGGRKFLIDRDTLRTEGDPDDFWAMVREFREEHKVDVLEDGQVVRNRDV